MHTVAEARALLTARFGHADFRDGQREAVEAILAGRDALVVLPTGGGKSVCYQVPALLRDGLTIVISPLISLMKDQVDALTARGIPAAFVNSTLTPGEVADRFARVRDGSLRLLYVAPERFELGRTAERLAEAGVSLLAIDEAHCISEWGHDFRPSYRRVHAIREALGFPQTVALTATATPAVRRDIAEQLGLADPAVIVSGFDRRNLEWHVLATKNDAQKEATLVALLEQVAGPCIVYASTRKAVERVAALLDRAGVRARAYHAGLDDDERHAVQDAFLAGRLRVIVATNAFGMGIDKPDVRLVVHWAMPGSLEAYYQEAGRAGRDGAPSHCVLLHAFPDRFTHEFFIDAAHPEPAVVTGTYAQLRRSARGGGAVHVDAASIAGRLPGKVSDRAVEAAVRILEQGGALRPAQATDAVVTLRWSPAEVTRHFGSDGHPLLTVLRGLWRAAGAALSRGAVVSLDALPGVEWPIDDVTAALAELAAMGALTWSASEAADVVLVAPSRELDAFAVDWDGLARRRRAALDQLDAMQRYAYADRCRRAFVLRYFGDPSGRRTEACGGCDRCLGSAAPFEVVSAPAGAGRASGRRKPPAGSVPRAAADPDAELSPEEAARFEQLRAWRARHAKETRVPAYIILPDRSLKALAVDPPHTMAELGGVPGIGPAKLERFGEELLALLTG